MQRYSTSTSLSHMLPGSRAGTAALRRSFAQTARVKDRVNLLDAPCERVDGPLGHHLLMHEVDHVHSLCVGLQPHASAKELICISNTVVFTEQLEEHPDLVELQLEALKLLQDLGVLHHYLELRPVDCSVRRTVSQSEDLVERHYDLLPRLHVLHRHPLRVYSCHGHGLLQEQRRNDADDGKVDNHRVQYPEEREPWADVLDERPREVRGPLGREGGLEHGVRRPSRGAIVHVDPVAQGFVPVDVFQDTEVHLDQEHRCRQDY
mmetsp:Transcript_97663/g.304569  ORF Transcript_97663/g.304569 Transcript_97663/m.304569 type:complete len:263 (-) Transcript_97663:736-1524(-)